MNFSEITSKTHNFFAAYDYIKVNETMRGGFPVEVEGDNLDAVWGNLVDSINNDPYTTQPLEFWGITNDGGNVKATFIGESENYPIKVLLIAETK